MRFPSPIPAAAIALAALASAAGAQSFKPGPKIGPPRPGDMAAAMQDPLAAVIASSQRPSVDVVRDVFRHPEASLKFWGLRPGMTVVDLDPGAGYWTEILAPYLKATGGRYIAATSPRGRAAFAAKHADKGRYGDIGYAVFDKGAEPIGPPASADLVLSAREIHNWMADGYVDKAMAQVAAVLKPGGIFAVEDHRADGSKVKADGSQGYVRTADVVAAAQRAGLKLDAASEINANPRDTKDYPFGVWTLPPSRQSAADGKSAPPPGFDRAKYDAIGESDRMTLRFRKPG